MIYPFQNHKPKLHESVWMAPTSVVIGDVEMGEGSSVWFQTVIRGDVNQIRIGKHTNIQDLTMIHVTNQHSPRAAQTTIGNHVTVGHRAILHGCTISNHCLIGMGAVVMDHVLVGERSIVGAGALVVEGTKIPPKHLAVGSPAKVVRELKEEEILMIDFLSEHYRLLALEYKNGGVG